MQIEVVEVKDLHPLEKNVRYHTETQINEMVRALAQFGQTRPFVIDEDNNILIGNCMYMAMCKSGQLVANAYRIIGLTPAKKKKLVLSDNRIYSLGGDKSSAIEEYIREIAAEDDLDIAGFDENILKELIRSSEEVEKSVMSYGSLPQDSIDRALDNLERNVQQQKSYVEQQVDNSSRPTQDNSHEARISNQVTVSDTTQGKANEARTIICPNCGEVIRI